MGKITFILGGARSGKSTHALELAKKHRNVTFIATCQALDSEMKKRIKLHMESRPSHWQTLEEYNDISSALNRLETKANCVIIDCLTLFISNLMLSGSNQDNISNRASRLLAHLKTIKPDCIIVSNEVGLGIVPNNKLARDFRDIAGKVNQIFAKEADKVIFMVAGIPMLVKEKKHKQHK